MGVPRGRSRVVVFALSLMAVQDGGRHPLWPAVAMAAVHDPAAIAAPVTFVPNHGQVGKRDVAYVTATGWLTAFFRPGEVVLDLRAAGDRRLATLGDARTPRRAVVRLRFVGANPAPAIAALDPLPGRVDFLRGNDPGGWVTDVPAYGGIVYRDVYPGIDLHYRGERGGLKSEFHVAPGADPGRIRLAYLGAEARRLSDTGALIVETAAGTLTEAPPVLYQEDAGSGRRTLVPGRYVLGARGRVGFAVGRYDPRRPLVIDPSLAFSRYLGGSSGDRAHAVAFHPSGSIHLVGETSSTDFPKFDFVQGTYGGGITDAFVTKLNADGVLLRSTYLGGSGEDVATAVAVDATANTYVVGATDSTDFPTQGPLQGSNAGGVDGFVAKLNPQGNGLVYGTYLGGSGRDTLLGVALDGSGNVYVAGQTESSTDFPLASALQGTFGGGTSDAVVAKLDGAGSALTYSTYLGGSGNEAASAVAVESGAAYVAGSTTSTDFNVANALQGSSGGGPGDGFVAKVDAAGSALDYSTYLGGSGTDNVAGIAADASGNAYVTGDTSSSTTFPLASALQATYGGGISDAFVTKIAAGGGSLAYSTFLGGAARDQGNAVAVDGSGRVVVVGLTDTPTTFPTASPLQAANAGSFDAFITQVDAAGASLLLSTYLGGSNSDFAEAVAVNTTGDQIVVAGKTESTNFPTAGTLDKTLAGGQDAFVLRLGMSPATNVPVVSTGGAVMLAILLVGTMTRTWRRGVLAGLPPLLAALLLAHGAAAYTVARTIVWSDASGRPGVAALQGTVENQVLRGVVWIEGVEFRVRGTQAADGAVAGTLYGSDGAPAGAFSARVAADDVLRGTLDLSGAAASWETPARE